MRVKRLIHYFFTSLLFFPTNNDVFGQVVFCPAGATWNYSFVHIPAWGGIYNFVNEQITYTHDSVLDGSPVKVLQHKYYYYQCYNVGWSQLKHTCIKQKGDTVFFRNARTNHTWQILYNYATQQGDSWTTTLLKADNTTYSLSITVDSVGQVIRNGHTLRRLYIPGGDITERFGNAKFLFHFPSYAAGCDGYYFAEFLCYSDSAFGKSAFTDKSCFFSGQIDINSLGELSEDAVTVFPNPTKDALFVQLDGRNIETVTLWTATGKKIKEETVMSGQVRISLTDLPEGLYLMDIRTNDRLIQRRITRTH